VTQNRPKDPGRFAPSVEKAFYLAYCIARVSRMTFTLISPGYCTAFWLPLCLWQNTPPGPSPVGYAGRTWHRSYKHGAVVRSYRWEAVLICL